MKTEQRIPLTAVGALLAGIVALSVNAQSQQPSQGGTASQTYGESAQQKGPSAQNPTGDQQSAGSQNKAESSSAPAGTTSTNPTSSTGQQAAGSNQKWEPGATLAKEYRAKNFVVDDWKGHGLKKPARGREWIQHGGDYILIDKSTGKIVEVQKDK